MGQENVRVGFLNSDPAVTHNIIIYRLSYRHYADLARDAIILFQRLSSEAILWHVSDTTYYITVVHNFGQDTKIVSTFSCQL